MYSTGAINERKQMTKEEIKKNAKELKGFFFAGDIKYPFSQLGEVFHAQINDLPLPTPKLKAKSNE